MPQQDVPTPDQNQERTVTRGRSTTKQRPPYSARTVVPSASDRPHTAPPLNVWRPPSRSLTMTNPFILSPPSKSCSSIARPPAQGNRMKPIKGSVSFQGKWCKCQTDAYQRLH